MTTKPAAYWRLGDEVGSYQVKDSSGNGYTGSLLDGGEGTPAYGQTGFFLYDPNTALDLTNGSNVPNTGFWTVDASTQPPTVHNPLSGASAWTVEGWFKWTGSDAPSNSASPLIPNRVLFHGLTNSGSTTVEIQAGSANATTQGIINNQLMLVISGGTPSPAAYTLGLNVFDGNVHYFALATAQGSPSDCFFVVDGKLVNSVQTFTGTVASPTSITIGTAPFGVNGLDPDGGTNYALPFDGTLQDIALYASGSILSSTLINHYNVGTWFQTEEYGASVGTSAAGRLNKVLSVVGLNPAIVLNVPYGFKTLLYAESNPVATTSALNYIQTQTETEPGLIFQAPTGMIDAYNRQYQYFNTTTLINQATFIDSASSSYFYDGPSLQIVQDDLDIWNDIQVQSGRGAAATESFGTAPGGTQSSSEAPLNLFGGGQLQEWGPAQSEAAAVSASVYGQRTLQGLTSLQQQYDTDALALAQWYGAIYNFPLIRVTQIMLNSQGNQGANLVQMLARGLYDKFQIEYEGQTPGPTFSQVSLVEQVSHTIQIDNGPFWQTSYAMSPYELLLYPIYFGVWQFGDTAAEGVLTL